MGKRLTLANGRVLLVRDRPRPHSQFHPPITSPGARSCRPDLCRIRSSQKTSQIPGKIERYLTRGPSSGPSSWAYELSWVSVLSPVKRSPCPSYCDNQMRIWTLYKVIHCWKNLWNNKCNVTSGYYSKALTATVIAIRLFIVASVFPRPWPTLTASYTNQQIIIDSRK